MKKIVVYEWNTIYCPRGNGGDVAYNLPPDPTPTRSLKFARHVSYLFR